MTDKQFHLLCTLFMVSDPWPLSDEEHKAAEQFLDEEARRRGWKDWLGAYHQEAKEPAPAIDDMHVSFVDFDPHFSIDQDEERDEFGQVWLRDAEGVPMLRCDRDHAEVIAAALEYAQASLAAYRGIGWGNITDDQAVELFRDMDKELPT